MNPLCQALADRLDQGADALAVFASTLSEAEWATRVPKDGRTVGVMVHHVASVYPIEIQLAQALAAGNPIVGVTWEGIHQMNADHASKNGSVTKKETLELLRTNSTAASRAVRALSDSELTQGGTISLYADAPLTCQFMLEDHAVRHSYHHLAKIKAALAR
ncbi:MAG: DinB family protein [Vicinamibacteria bacterium]